jgi:hypothetical protein
VTVICSAEQVRLTGEPPKIYAKAGDNGPTRFSIFEKLRLTAICERWGGTDDFGIRWGSICQRDELKPMRQIWCRSAASWINDLKSLPGLAME